MPSICTNDGGSVAAVGAAYLKQVGVSSLPKVRRALHSASMTFLLYPREDITIGMPTRRPEAGPSNQTIDEARRSFLPRG
jgi:hypothetical protein